VIQGGSGWALDAMDLLLLLVGRQVTKVRVCL
jgi:hypothetical protein